MKKWLVGLLVLLAVLLLVSPGIVGMLAERGLNEAVRQAERGAAEITVTTERFERSWFTSAGRHRIELNNGEVYLALAKLAREAGEESVPALIINTELEHGFWPMGSAPDNAASRLPVLARSVSTMQLETGSGDFIELPGTLYTEVSLGGITRSHYLLPPGSFENPGVRGQWGGADLLASVAVGGRPASISGRIEPWSIDTGLTNVQMASLEVDAWTEGTQFGFDVGYIQLAVAKLSFTNADESIALESLSLHGNSDIRDERLSGNVDLHVGGLSLPTLGEIAVDLTLLIREVDAESFQHIVTAVQAAQSSSNPQLAMANIDDVIESDFLTLLTRGADIRIDRFNLNLPQGAMTGTFMLDLPRSDSRDVNSWAGLALQMTATANIGVDERLLQFAQATNPELSALVAMGYLRRDGGMYTLNAEIANGVVTINGAPMSVPASVE